MIIKSMSRKAPTFRQLADYIARGSNAQTGTVFVRNLYASGQDRAAVVGQFLGNHRYLPARKGGNALYHEVIVLEPQTHLPPEQVEEALHALAERYCERRAPHQLAWGRVHRDTDFPHIHLMISANAVRSDRRVRMERAYFAQVQRDLEAWRAAHLPALNARVIYGHEHTKDTPRQPIQEGEMVRRLREPSKKQMVHEQIKAVLVQAESREELKPLLQEAGYQLYQRGQSWGVLHVKTGRKHRLKTLGLQAAFGKLPDRPRRQQHQSTPSGDDRADDLLRQRMTQQARDALDGFDRDDR